MHKYKFALVCHIKRNMSITVENIIDTTTITADNIGVFIYSAFKFRQDVFCSNRCINVKFFFSDRQCVKYKKDTNSLKLFYRHFCLMRKKIKQDL